MPIPLSVVLITLNPGPKLEKCLHSCQWAQQIIILDSGSTDETYNIATKYNAKIQHQDWLGFGKQKQKATKLADHDWILSLDADEWLSDELSANIQQLFQKSPSQNAYFLTRCNCFMGRFLKHGEGYPDPILRLFNRQYAKWTDHEVHEYVTTTEKTGKINGDLMHESGEDIQHYLTKQNRYTTLQAKQLWQKKKKIGCNKLILSPLLRFAKFYLIRQGFRDGIPGLVHIAIGCWNSFIKYAKLIEYKRKGKIN